MGKIDEELDADVKQGSSKPKEVSNAATKVKRSYDLPRVSSSTNKESTVPSTRPSRSTSTSSDTDFDYFANKLLVDDDPFASDDFMNDDLPSKALSSKGTKMNAPSAEDRWDSERLLDELLAGMDGPEDEGKNNKIINNKESKGNGKNVETSNGKDELRKRTESSPKNTRGGYAATTFTRNPDNSVSTVFNDIGLGKFDLDDADDLLDLTDDDYDSYPSSSATRSTPAPKKTRSSSNSGAPRMEDFKSFEEYLDALVIHQKKAVENGAADNAYYTKSNNLANNNKSNRNPSELDDDMLSSFGEEDSEDDEADLYQMLTNISDDVGGVSNNTPQRRGEMQMGVTNNNNNINNNIANDYQDIDRLLENAFSRVNDGYDSKDRRKNTSNFNNINNNNYNSYTSSSGSGGLSRNNKQSGTREPFDRAESFDRGNNNPLSASNGKDRNVRNTFPNSFREPGTYSEGTQEKVKKSWQPKSVIDSKTVSILSEEVKLFGKDSDNKVSSTSNSKVSERFDSLGELDDMDLDSIFQFGSQEAKDKPRDIMDKPVVTSAAAVQVSSENDDKNSKKNISLENYTVVQLKELLKKNGLAVKGVKADLIERLSAAGIET